MLTPGLWDGRIVPMRRLIFLALFLASLACAAQVPTQVEPFRPIPAELRTRLEGLRTPDLAEQRRRWGPLADLAGKVWISFNGFGPATGGFEAYWVIEGSALQVYHFSCPRDAACLQRTWLITAVPEDIHSKQPNFSIEFSDRPTGRGFTDEDFYVVFSGFNTARFRFDPQTGVGGFGTFRYRPATEENLKEYQARGVVLESQRAERVQQAALAREQAAQAQAKADAARQEAAAAAAQRQKQEEDQRATAKRMATEQWTAQRQALAARFPTIAAGETRTPVIAAGGNGTSIHYLRHDKPGKLRVEAVSSSFAPLVGVYEIDKPQPLATADAASGAPARVSVPVAADTRHYVIAVQPLDGKRGAYALKVEQD
jgi:hypothetical protein